MTQLLTELGWIHSLEDITNPPPEKTGYDADAMCKRLLEALTLLRVETGSDQQLRLDWSAVDALPPLQTIHGEAMNFSKLRTALPTPQLTTSFQIRYDYNYGLDADALDLTAAQRAPIYSIGPDGTARSQDTLIRRCEANRKQLVHRRLDQFDQSALWDIVPHDVQVALRAMMQRQHPANLADRALCSALAESAPGVRLTCP